MSEDEFRLCIIMLVSAMLALLIAVLYAPALPQRQSAVILPWPAWRRDRAYPHEVSAEETVSPRRPTGEDMA